MQCFLNKFFMKKLFLMVIFFSILSFSSPTKVNAQYTDIPNTTKEYGLDGFANAVAKIALKKLTSKTVNWINSGFKGNPAYIQNPKQFFLDIGDNVASDFLSQAGINQICSPFKAQVRLALVKNYISEADENYSCTLSILKDNYDAFTNDFAQGGWQGWFEITQNSQNNPYGSYLAAKSTLAIKIGTEKNQYQKELDLSGGFLNYKRCPRGGEYVTPGGEKRCSVEEETVTPGSAINEQLNRSLGSSWSQLEAADELDEIVTALVTQLVEQVAGKVGGLFGASEAGSGSSGGTLTGEIYDQPQPPPTSGPITATQPSINCNSTGGSATGGDGGSGGSIDPATGEPYAGGGGTGGSSTGGTSNCVSTPGTIDGVPGWPGWPLGGDGGTTGGGGGTGGGGTGTVTAWAWLDRGGPAYVSTKCPSTDPQSYFGSLISGAAATDWVAVLNSIEPNLWACGIGQQRDSAGNVRGRLFLPNAACPDASGGNGVKNDPSCWTHPVDVTQ